MARTSNFANVATVTRASTKTDAGGWDFTSGGTVGTLTEYASGVAAIHPTAGLLVEESTTNEVRNPRCEGAVAGTPGTLPTNWASSGTATVNVIGSGTDGGWPYVDVQWTGTPSGYTSLFFEGSSQIVAASGETWTASCGVKIVGGDLTNVTSVEHNIQFVGTPSTFVTASIQSGLNASHKRWIVSGTAGAGTTHVRSYVTVDASAAIDITLRIYVPQLEEKAYPTSPVLPVAASPAAATRAADDVTIPNGAWSNDGGAGSFFLNVQPNALFNTARLFEYGPATNATRFNLNLSSSGALTAFYQASSTAYVNDNIKTGVAVADDLRVAIAADTNDFAASVSGGTQFTDASITLFTDAARAELGGWWSTGNGNCYIKDFRYWPKRLTNAELEALVGN